MKLKCHHCTNNATYYINGKYLCGIHQMAATANGELLNKPTVN